MSRRGTRSKQAITRRKIKYELKCKIQQEAWRDIRLGETVCLTAHETLVTYGYNTFGEHFSCTYIPDVNTGYVLSDSYGRGCFQ